METTCFQYWNRFCPTIFGTGALGELVTKAKEFKMHKILFVTEKALMDLKVSSPIKELLENAGFEVVVFDDIIADPNNHLVTQGAALAKETGIDGIVAVGGGTVLDVAKILSLRHVSPILDLYDGKLPVEKGKELILVPTTCGTGTEVTNISILALLSRRTKKGLANDAMYADQAVLVPELLGGLPFRFFTTSSIDALIHAIESSLSPKANPITKLFGYRAIEMILKGYQAIQKDGPDARLPLLGDFLLASNFAGIAFGNAGCAAVHALAYPLGAVYHVPHGESNYAVFTGVMKQYMRLKTDGAIAELNQFMANILGCEVANLYTALEDLLGCLIPKKSLREYGMTEAEIEAFADSVVENQQRLLANNFVPLKRDQIRDIYRAVY